MKLENLERAKAAKNELKELDFAIKTFENKLDDVGSFRIQEHSDASGLCIHCQYKNGYAHPMYKDIFAFAYERFIQARKDLIAEIESL